MNKKVSSLLILTMIFLSSMVIIFQDSPFTPYISQNEGNSEEELSDNDPISTNDIVDYSEQGEDVNNPQASTDFSQIYYKYKNDTLQQANDTIEYLISNLWDSIFKGFNESDVVDAKKRTHDNMLMIIKLLEYYDTQYQIEYITYAEDIFDFEYNYLWDNETNLFLSYCDSNGNNALALTNSTDNALAILALLKLYSATNNQTYLEIANSTFAALNSVFYDGTNGGYYRSNESGDTNKHAYENLLISTLLVEIYQLGYLSSNDLDTALERAEETLDLLITHYLNGTYGVFSAGDSDWDNPVEEKNALDNALAIIALISLYEINSNQTYLNFAGEIAEFIDTAFWDSTGLYRGYNTTVSWDGSITINSTKYLEVNSLIMEAYLKLFEKTYNSTHYLGALNISRFLNTYLWDSTANTFNYSVDFNDAAANSSLKTTAANAWAIQALLGFRYQRPFLTRANTTMTMIERYLSSNGAFDTLTMYDWSSLSSQILYDLPFLLTLADLFGDVVSSSLNLYTIYTLLELSEETRLDDYTSLANETMYFLNETGFDHAFMENASTGLAEPEFSYSTETNAWGILALLDLYEKTNDIFFLEMANETWRFLNETLWDVGGFGYNTSTTDNLSKDFLANCLMIWANLAIINSSYPIFDDIRNQSSNLVNLSVNVLNQMMWDTTNFGYYSNASSDWTPITTGEDAKKTRENCIMLLTLLKYNNIYPNNPNQTLYEERINQTIEFLLEHLWDYTTGGFYYSCTENGSSQNTDKYTHGNNWATLTFLELYENTGNFSYYLLAEEINNFVNTYLWDFEYGGYFHWCSHDGVPYYLGQISGVEGEILLSFKFLENQISSVLALTRLSAVKNPMPFPLIVDIEFQPERLDRGPLKLYVTLSLIDIEGVQINQANLSISTSGVYQNIAGENFYGFARRTFLENQYGTNDFSGRLDISPFFVNFYLTVSGFNSSMAVTWFILSGNRTFDVYLSKAFDLLASIDLFTYDIDYGGYRRNPGADLTKFAYDNWLAILASLEYYNASGLNLFYNLSSFNLEQVLTTYIADTFYFLNDTFFFSPENETSIAFYSSADYDGSDVNLDIFCKDTALAIIALLKYYQVTNNSNYLDMANRTWAFLNSTLWDTEYLGYMHENGIWGNQTKYTIDNIWAVMANLAIYNTPQINQTVRDSAMEMANLTLQLLNQSIWDNELLGFYSTFNGSTWIPFNTSIYTKRAYDNILAIQAFIQFADLINNSKSDDYINYANETYLFINQSLKDNEFLGYFSSCNWNGTEFNTNKTLAENSLMILALLDLYRANNYNYTYYQLAEETLFYIDRYFKNPYLTIYHNESSQFGAIFYDFTNLVPLESSSNFMFLRSLTYTDLERQQMYYPLVISDITVESPQLGEVQDTVNITLKVSDSNGNPVENATVIGVIYGRYEVFSFTKVTNNIYYCIVNISSVAGNLEINFRAFKEGYSAGRKVYSFSRSLPVYVQKSYETLIALIVQLWNDIDNIFYMDKQDYPFEAFANFMAIEALEDLAEIGGDILWAFDWYANRTLLSYSSLVANNLKNILISSTVQVDSKNVSGYISKIESGVPVNLTECAINAQAVITYLELYNRTGDPIYLELANNTWLYLNETFWDPVNFGYYSDNSTTSNNNKSLAANCLAILANLAINETLEINSTIRNQAFMLANLTFFKINQSLWDTVNGSYYAYCDNDWSAPRFRTTVSNALMILTLLRFYSISPTQTNYLHTANVTGDLLIRYLYDAENGGFLTILLNNFSLKEGCSVCKTKYLDVNSWAILALAELYRINGNTTFYYKAEETMNFLNSRLANHFNEYLNLQIDDVNGYWDSGNQSGWVLTKPQGDYLGTLESSALVVQALLKLYTVANLTLPWLNATVQILPASSPPIGEYCNLTISIMNENGMKIESDLVITMVGWKRVEGESEQVIIQELSYEYDSNSQEYKVKDVNLSTVFDIYFNIFAKNDSYATYWNTYYLRRTLSIIPVLWGVGGDYIASENYYQYTIGEDVIIVEGFYADYENLYGIPDATLNFTVHFPNATIWFSELVTTNSSGWAQLVFGPVPNIAELFGRYNITVYTSHVNNTITPITWYASTTSLITINIDYGISIPHFYPIEPIVAQGDKIQCNVTIKHRMLANLSVNILIYSGGVLIPSTVSRNLTTGYNYFIVESEVDERTPIGSHFIYINITFENKVIRDSYFFIAIVSAAIIRNYYVPTWIAEDDVRYAVLEIQHRKIFETSNISIKIDCAALEENPTIQILQPSTQLEYYVPLYVKADIPYGTYSGEIIVQRVNYTLDYEGSSLTFQIEVKPAIELVSFQFPSGLAQNQQAFTAITLQSNKIDPIVIKIVGYGDGFNDYEEIFIIGPGETETLNTPIIYYKNPWDSGLREYTIEIYYFNSSSEYTLISSNTAQINISYSLNSILLGFILPSTVIAVILIWLLWQREKKKRERKKLK